MIIPDPKMNKHLEKLQHLFNSNIIMNWSNIHKSIMMLFLILGVHFVWIAWKFLIISEPKFWQWVNLPLLKTQVYLNIYTALLVSCLIIFCYFFQKKPWVNTILPHFILGFFVNVMLVDGFW